MPTLTRLNLTSLLIVLLAACVIGFAGYFLLLENGKAHHQLVGTRLANSITVAITKQQQQLRIISQDTRVTELVSSPAASSQNPDHNYRWLSTAFPDTANIQIIRKNDVINLGTTPATHDTAFLKKYLQGTRPLKPYYHADSQIGDHYDLVQPVRVKGDTSAALVLSYPIKLLDRLVRGHLPKKGQFEIVYRRPGDELVSILKLGKLPVSDQHAVLTTPITNTDWQIRLTLPRLLVPLSARSWFYIVIISLAIGVIIINSVILYFKTTRSIEHDLHSLARLFKDVRAGKVRVDYPMALGEFRKLFDYIRETGKKITMEKQAARDMGLIDHLTQVSNRRHFESKLQDLFTKAGELGPSAVLLIDLDHFKKVNDQFGHEAGDVLLVEFSRVLKRSVRNTDFVARLGGDEFCVVYTYTTLGKAGRLAELLRERLPQEIFLPRNRTYPLRWTGGLSIMEKSDGKYDDVLTRADQALYQAKDKGRNNTIVFKQKGKPGNTRHRHKPG